jgi:hypothetical protein
MGYFMLAALAGAFPFGQQVPRTAPKLATPVAISRPRIVLQPGQVCAIPLLNVLPRNWNGDRHMMVPVPGWPASSKEVIQPPAPSCDDVR